MSVAQGGHATRPAAPPAEPPPQLADAPWPHVPPFIPRLLRTLAEERDAAEVEITSLFASRTQAADSALREETQHLESTHATRATKIDHEERSRVSKARALLSEQTHSIQAEHKQARAALSASIKQKSESAQAASDRARWEAGTLHEASMQGESQRHEQTRGVLAEEAEILAAMQTDANMIANKYKRIYNNASSGAALPPIDPKADPIEAWRAATQSAEDGLLALSRLKAPKLLSGANPLWLVIVPWLLLAWPAIHFLGATNGLIAATVGALALGLAIGLGVFSLAKKALATRIPALRAALDHSEKHGDHARQWSESTHKRILQEIEEKRTSQFARIEEKLATTKRDCDHARAEGLARIDLDATTRQSETEAAAQAEITEATASAARDRNELKSWRDSEQHRIRTDHERRQSEAHTRRDSDWTALRNRWESGIREIQAAVSRVDSACAECFLDWNQPASAWSPPREVPPAIRFGNVDIELARIPHGTPRDDTLRSETPSTFTLPALLTFPDRASLLIRATAAGRDAGIILLQAAMLRFVTSLPPGKVRFTIIDPVGLGRNFAAFMHLADYSELMVTNRIWTEPAQIEERLADLSLHMETVIQQFLRNEFANLEEYNRQAAEVAEPYRLLVIANFPANFSDSSAQRLLSVMQGGARCGVHTLILIDEDVPIPSSVRVEDLQAHATTLFWRDGQFQWNDPDFAGFPLATDTPPADDRLTPLLHQVGQATRAASRVEVPFDVIAPKPDAWWSESTRDGVNIALGRAGATKLQMLQLGKGTSQHVLIAGRTGSGKSTLLHALITNAALRYSPDEVEFYLIDFKKGVEFQTYAQWELPHARVVAIESEREFGLSVLQRLDEELRRRGEAFRAAGVQDLAGYRSTAGLPPMPRTLLIVDEFQEFFVDDDKLAQDAALLLDRLVRQGRAFGVHVLLGSQTLGGAYSLARTTLGQMAVRIALQCGEADAHLILSEDNAAARLLTRPGEAIYNDANGLVEGNHVFQVVWLGEAQREDYLKRIHARHEGLGLPAGARPSQIVFEGHVPSDLQRNAKLRELLDAEAWPSAPKAPVAWLGEAVAIKDPTSFAFRKQGGNNVLVIGQDAPAARGLFASAFLSLAAQFRPGDARFVLLDGTPEDDLDHSALAHAMSSTPHGTAAGGPREAAAVLDSLANQLKSRQDDPVGAAPIFVFLFDGSRFRDLRKSDDDFGFGRREDEKPSPAQQLGELLREGPALGIHTIAWFDTLNNVQRVFDRGALREFEFRVLFQMSANDSSTLIDSPAANRLGAHRALACSEDQGTHEKFRPYALPKTDWLSKVSERLSQRADSRRDDPKP